MEHRVLLISGEGKVFVREGVKMGREMHKILKRKQVIQGNFLLTMLRGVI